MWILTGLFVITIIYSFLKYVYSYWDRVGIRYIQPNIPFGNLKSVATNQRSFGFAIYDLYKTTTEPFVGIYLFFRTAILVRDPELVRKILISDFSSFHDRGIHCNEENDPFSASLFSLPGARWKSLRLQLAPAFASGKIKEMFETILNIAKCMDKHLDLSAEKNEVVDMKDIVSRYALDIIGNLIFGLNVNSLDDPDHKFRTAVKRLLNPNIIETTRFALFFLCPRILDFLRLSGVDPVLQKQMVNIVRTTLEHRESNNVVKKDLMQLLLQLRNSGAVNEADDWEIKKDPTKVKSLSVERCAGEAFLFYTAGTETSAAAVSFCLYELSRHPNHMRTLQKEIDELLLLSNGKITFEILREFKFLDLCLSETLRMYPGLPILNRECTKDFNIPEKNFTIKKGTPIIISLFGIHRDPALFTDPDTFNPYRFAEGQENANSKYYFPFGDGPHICIGARMAKVVKKVALILMLSKYNFEKNNSENIEYSTNTVGLVAKNGINLKLSKRSETYIISPT